MSSSVTADPDPADAAAAARATLRRALQEAAHALPAQGPIGVFVHHNTLHAYEHLPFDEAVLAAAARYDAEPYQSEEAFRAAFRRGRIAAADLDAVVSQEPDGEVLPGLSRRQLRRQLLWPGVPTVDAASVAWRLDEGDLAAAFAAAGPLHALRVLCEHRLDDQVPSAPPLSRPHDEAIHPWLIRLCAVFVDQGLAYWPMPGREQGFYEAVRRLFAAPGVVLSTALAGADRAFAGQAAADLDAEQVVLAWLHRQGVAAPSWSTVLEAELLALPGWSGLFARLEAQPALAPHIRVPTRLIDFLAVRLTLDAAARANAAPTDVQAARDDAAVAAVRTARAVRLAMAADLLGLRAGDLRGLSDEAWHRWRDAVEAFDDLERRRLWHAAFEHRHECVVLEALASHRHASPPASRPYVSAQLFFCIDEREESMRRAVEEVDFTVETFGAAGFFGVAVNYQGLDDPGMVALCPIVVTPQHAIVERPHAEDVDVSARRTARRRLLGRLSRWLDVSSRSLLRGWVGTVALGVLTIVPLVGRVMAPRLFGRVRAGLNDLFLPEPRTELSLMRDDSATQAHVDGLLQGFRVEEKAACVASVLAPAGLTGRFARLVVIVGHGSTSLNNPHESAYDCGACGGRRGGPNARLLAAMANRGGVRAVLRSQGIDIPETTWFVGAYHDTCSDDVQLIDADSLPASHAGDLARLQQVLDEARARNAHERSRRFESCRLDVSPRDALVHVEERAEHLAQPRPECGHGTNAVCIIGRRAVTEGLFLDRRAFLVSYDPLQDADDRHLARLLAAAVPVCGGINLEYYFSFVDNVRYGCGNKLPHNITSLIGVMNGQSSDLRTGLPWQMVEIHEPVRILFVIETTPARLDAVLAASPAIGQLVRHRWIRVATLDPRDGRIHVWRDDAWVAMDAPLAPLPQAPSSRAWYAGQRDHLAPASIRPETTAAAREVAWT